MHTRPAHSFNIPPAHLTLFAVDNTYIWTPPTGGILSLFMTQVANILDELGFSESIIEKFRNEKVKRDTNFFSVVCIVPYSWPGMC